MAIRHKVEEAKGGVDNIHNKLYVMLQNDKCSGKRKVESMSRNVCSFK